MQKRKFMPVALNEVPAELWEPEAWHEQLLAIQRRLLSTATFLPREMAELEIKQMAHIGGGQYLKADDPAFVKHEDATLTGQPSSASAPRSSVEPLPTITKQEIMGHTVFRAATRQGRRKDDGMGQEFEDAISCRREDDHVIAEMLGITSDMDNCLGKGRPETTSTTTVPTSSQLSVTLLSMNTMTKRGSLASSAVLRERLCASKDHGST